MTQKKTKTEIEDIPIKWNSFENNKREKQRALKGFEDAKKVEKQQINSGAKYVRIDSKTIILKKK